MSANREQIILVTGSSRGIGAGAVCGLAHAGANIIGIHFNRNRDAALEIAKEVTKHGARPVLLQANFCHAPLAAAETLAKDFLDQVEQLTGERKFDVLVNNAGIGRPQALGSITEDTVNEVINTNLTTPIFLIQALTPHIKAGGRIINVSSVATRVALSDYSAYSASKSGLNALTLTLAPTLAARNITINAIAPGYIETDRYTERLTKSGVREAMENVSVFDRIGEVKEVTALICYLASAEASWTTGQVIDVSGGFRISL
jgi:3-oxoacyl-[acyl-carrier protein] reductase